MHRRHRADAIGRVTAVGPAVLLLVACSADTPSGLDAPNSPLADGRVDSPGRDSDATLPDLDPDPDGEVPPEVVPATEAWVVWESTRVDGDTSHVFKMRVHPEGERSALVQQLTGAEGGRTPMWSPDGSWIAFQHPVDNTAHVMRPDGSASRQLFGGPPTFWMRDGSGLVACEKGAAVHLVDPETGDSRLLVRKQDFARFEGKVMQPGGITHDGRYMVVGTDLYRYGHKGDNGVFTASFAAAIVDLTARDKVFFFGAGCAPRTPPAGDWVYHVCGDCPTKPDIYRMRLSDLDSRASYEAELAHPDPDWGHSYFPRISNDNRWLIYGASTGCHDAWTCDYEIFIHRLHSDPQSRTRMTFNPANDRAPDLFVGQPLRSAGSTGQ